MEKIVLLQLKQVKKRMADKQLQLTWDPHLVTHLAEEGYDPIYGARPLKRLIQKEVTSLLAKGILKEEIQGDSPVELKFENNKISLNLS